jgi:hypothetical protein
MKILPIFIIISTMMLIFLACDSDENVTDNNKTTVVGTGEVVSKIVDLAAFHSITNVAIANITVTKGTPQQVILKAQQNILDVMTYQVENGVLTLGFQENISIFSDKTIDAEITITDINRVTSIGAGNFELSGAKQGALNVDIIGAASVRAYNLEVDTCQVSIAGAGSVFVRVNNLLEVVISGTGSVFFRGNPTINSTITGTGSIVDDN